MKKLVLLAQISILICSVQILSAQTLDVTLGSKDSLCQGDSTNIRIIPKNPLKVTGYIWSTGYMTSMATDNTISVAPKQTTTYSITVTESGATAGSYTLTKVIYVMQPPKFSAGNDTTLCKGAPFLLEPAFESGTNMAYTWNSPMLPQKGGDALVQIAPNAGGDYFLEVKDAFNCTYIDTVSIQVVGAEANFSFVNMASRDLAFTELNLDNTVKRYWDFGDGITSNAEKPQHTFTTDGFYDICLSVIDPLNGCQNKKCDVLKVGNPKCDARFIEAESLMQSGKYNFNLLTIAPKTAVFWNFGDGAVSTQKSPDHVYAKPGFYNVSLAIYDSVNQCKGYYSKEIKIGQPRLKADFVYYTDLVSRTVVFKSVSVGKIKSHVWDFGNNKPSLMNLSATPIMKYDKQGVYKVCLAVTDDSNHVDYICKDIIVDTVACFSKFQTFVDSSKNIVYFKNATLGKNLQYFWEYGDGTASVKYEPFHKYIEPGLYEIALTVANEERGCVNKFSKVVVVGTMKNDCHSDFSWQDNAANKVYFGNKAMVNKAKKYTWDFGDGTKANGEIPAHVFPAKGYYNVCLTTEDESNKCKDTRCKVVRVGIDTTQHMACFNYHIMNDTLSVLFADQSLGEVKSYLWNFGDGAKSVLANPKHIYSKPGFYKVTQIVGDSKSKSFSLAVDVIPVGLDSGIKCAFDKVVDTLNQTKGVIPIEFKGAAYGEPSSFAWDFGDGNYDSTSLSPTHYYTEEGVYIACLTIYDEVFQQSDTYCDTVVIGVTSVQDVKTLTHFKVNPNPIRNRAQVYYVLNESAAVDITMYDLLGNKVKSVLSEQVAAGVNTTTIETSALSNGIYFIKVKAGIETQTFKVIVVK